MRRDEAGVAGFFEDLPVLGLILAGTLTIIITSTSISEIAQSEEQEEALEILADRTLDIVVAELLPGQPGGCVDICSLCVTKLAAAIGEFLDHSNFSFSVVLVHPDLEWLCSVSEESGKLPGRISFASCLLNGVIDDGRIGILLVRILVW